MKYVYNVTMARTTNILISNWPRKFRQLFKTASRKGQNLAGEFTQKIYTASWNLFTLTAEADRLLRQLVWFSTIFFHWMYKIKYSCYQESSVIHGWFVYWNFGWVMLVKVGNPISDGIIFVVHLAGCVRLLKSPKRFWPYLIAFRSCISNGKPE